MKLLMGLFITLGLSGAMAGQDTGGGNPIEQNFMRHFKGGMFKLKELAYDEYVEYKSYREPLIKLYIYWPSARKIVAQIKIEFVDRPLYDSDGVLKVALNHPKKFLIQVNRLEWNKLSTNEKEALAVHEVLGIVHGHDDYGCFDDSSYVITSALAI